MEIEQQIRALGSSSALLFFLVLLFLLVIMGLILWLGWWSTNRKGALSPYTGEDLHQGEDLAFSAMERVQRYLDGFSDPLNPTVDLTKSAICRQTGRIFPESVNAFGVIKVSWSFLQKHHRGNWVSWGSLSEAQKKEILLCHDSVEGYQIERSCSEPDPQEIDLFHAKLRPGPLYVDIQTRQLLGWKNVPKTVLEVLILQRPYREPPVEKEEKKIEDIIVG